MFLFIEREKEARERERIHWLPSVHTPIQIEPNPYPGCVLRLVIEFLTLQPFVHRTKLQPMATPARLAGQCSYHCEHTANSVCALFFTSLCNEHFWVIINIKQLKLGKIQLNFQKVVEKDLCKSLHSYSQYWSNDLQRFSNENVFLLKEVAACGCVRDCMCGRRPQRRVCSFS